MYKRKWVQKPVINSKHAENDRSFTVATYNLLGDKMMEVGQYLHMRWDQQRTHYRHQLLVRDMEHLQSDILCLQEVEQENWNTYYYDELRRLGYEGIYHPRSDGLGLAVCYRCDKWQNKSHEGYTLHDLLNSAVIDMVQDTQDRKDLLDFIHKPSTVLYVSLTHIASREDVIVANIHTVWDDLRQPQLVALQACAAMEGYRKYFQKDGKSLIFLGDFNTPPSCPLYHMLSGGVVTKDLFQTPSSTEDQKLKNIGSKLFQLMPNMYTLKFNLESAYKTVLGKEPGITSADCAPSYTAYCLDYVWYTPHSLQVQGVLETPTEDLILDPHVFPVTEHFPSDHIPLLVKFGFLEIN